MVVEQGEARENEAHSFKQLLRSYAECFNRENARRTLGSAIPICAQQLTGLSFLNNYASLFFRQIGFSNAFLVTTIMSTYFVGPWSHLFLTRMQLQSPSSRRHV